MRFFLRLVAVFIALITISGCVGAMPEYKSSQSSYIILKTPKLAYADMGFVSKASDEVKVEIYSSGQSLVRLRVTANQVCMSSLECMDAKRFNKEYLGASYPKDTLYRVFKQEPIFAGKNKKALADGFMQKIGSIVYKVEGKKTAFFDKSRGVKIEIK